MGNPKPSKLWKGEVMIELLFFVLGLMIGGLTGITVMCCLQINKMNEIAHEE